MKSGKFKKLQIGNHKGDCIIQVKPKQKIIFKVGRKTVLTLD